MPNTTPSSDASLPDDALVDRVRNGDEPAFAILIARHHDMLRCVAGKRLRHAQHIDAVVHDAFVFAFEHLDRYRTPGGFGPWLRAIAHNLALEEARRQQRSCGSGRMLSDLEAPADASGDDHAWAAALLPALRACLDQLSERARQLITIRYTENLSLAELGQRWNSSEQNVAVQLFRIRQALRACVDQHRVGT